MASSGSVHTEFTASTAQVREEMERGKKAAARFASGMKDQMRRVRGSSVDGAKSVGVVTREMGKFDQAVRGAPGAISAAAGSLQLFGAKGSAAVQTVSSALASMLASGFTPIGLAIGAATAAVAYFAVTSEDSFKRFEESAKAAATAANSTVTELERVNAQVDLLGTRGAGSGSQARLQVLRDSIAAMRADVADARRDGDEDAIAAAEDALAARKREIATLEQIIAAEARLERDRAAREKEERKRAERRAERTKERAKEEADAARASAAAAAEKERIDKNTAARAEELRKALLAVENVGKSAEEIERRERESRIASLTRQEREQFGRGSQEAGAQDIRAQIAHEQAMLEVLDRRIAAEKALAEAEAARLRLQREAAEADEQRRQRQEQQKRDEKEQKDRREQLAGELVGVQRDLSRELESLDMDETERAVAAVEDRYAELIERARAHGLETVELERLIQERIARIRAGKETPSTEPGNSTPDEPDRTFGDGIEDGISRARDGLREVGELGERTGVALADSFSAAFNSFAMGAQSSSDAFKQFARSFLADTAAMIVKAAILAGLESVVTFGASAEVGAASFAVALSSITSLATGLTGFAKGGSFMVGGVGGIDSQLVAFRASPNERVTVQTPAQQSSGGMGNVSVKILNQGPPLAARAQVRAGPDGLTEIIINTVVQDYLRNGRIPQAQNGNTRRLRGGSPT